MSIPEDLKELYRNAFNPMDADTNGTTIVCLIERIGRVEAENAKLKEALTKIWEVASGESQVAMDDTAGMEWISDYASSLWDDDGKFAARAGGK